jgi:hypothetical protein
MRSTSIPFLIFIVAMLLGLLLIRNPPVRGQTKPGNGFAAVPGEKGG